MKQTLKAWACDWLPPILVRALKSSIRSVIGFHGDYATWEEAVAASTGYDQASILEKVKNATLAVKRGEATYERDSVLFEKVEYSWPVLAGLMWAAAQGGGRLAVLDFGGSLGSGYFQNLKFLHELADVRWGVVDQPHYVACGRDHIQDERLRFYETIEECVGEMRPNVVLLGSVLQYLRAPYQILHQMSQIGRTLLIIDRTPFSNLDEDRISVQHVPPSIYAASYPSYIFSRRTFDKKIREHWTLIEKFECAEGVLETDKGITFSFNGMLLTR